MVLKQTYLFYHFSIVHEVMFNIKHYFPLLPTCMLTWGWWLALNRNVLRWGRSLVILRNDSRLLLWTWLSWRPLLMNYSNLVPWRPLIMNRSHLHSMHSLNILRRLSWRTRSRRPLNSVLRYLLTWMWVGRPQNYHLTGWWTLPLIMRGHRPTT